MTTWTTERVELLHRYYGKNMTASELGALIGVSKNAVIGKAQRMGLGSKLRGKAFLVPTDAVKKPAEKPVKGRTLDKWKRGLCQYPIGRNKRGQHVFCCVKVYANGENYCLTHARVCYTRKITV